MSEITLKESETWRDCLEINGEFVSTEHVQCITKRA